VVLERRLEGFGYFGVRRLDAALDVLASFPGANTQKNQSGV
jgi:hypothetical protein